MQTRAEEKLNINRAQKEVKKGLLLFRESKGGRKNKLKL